VDATEEQRARNELLFREVNERVEEMSNELNGTSDSMISFVCECGRTDCRQRIAMTQTQYEALRANPKHFAVLPGHEDTRIARVVERRQGFLVAEKKGEAAKLAIEHNPRGE
jgi:hypothetical protein